MIDFENVCFSYEEGVPILQDINFSVKAGECAILCGKSGMGKSTILRAISGLVPLFYEGSMTGKVKVDGVDPVNFNSQDRAKSFGVVSQDPRSQFFMNIVQDEICFAAENIGMSAKEILKKLIDVSKLLNIENLLSRNLDGLSSGEKQKVAIASALLLKPKVLILDEPISNIDKRGVDNLIEVLKLIKSLGIAIIISEHRLIQFKDVADKFLHIYEGKITEVWYKKDFDKISNEKLIGLGLRPKSIKKTSTLKDNKQKSIVLDISHVSYKYEKTYTGISDIDLKVYEGEVISLMGDNGSGKTTLCKVISGLLKEQSGKLLYRNTSIKRKRRNKICYFVMQDADYQLYSDSIESEILLGKKISSQANKKLNTSLDMFNLQGIKNRHPASLSGGEKQRVILAAAYCSDAEIYILDEPTSGIDGDGLNAIIQWVNTLSHMGKTVIIITHDELLSTAISDRIIYLADGRINVK